MKCLLFILSYLVLSSFARQELKRVRTANETKLLHSSHDAARPRKKSLRIGKDSAAAQPPAVVRPPQPPGKVNAMGGFPCEKAIAAPGDIVSSETMPLLKGGSATDSGDFKENLSKQLPSITTRHLQSGQQKFVCKVINSSGGVKRLMEGMQGRTLLSWRIAYKIISADDESADDDVLADDHDVADDCDVSENDEQVVGMSVAFSTETCWFVSAAAFGSHVEFWGICHKILTSGNALKVSKNASAHTHTLTYKLLCDRSSCLSGHSTLPNNFACVAFHSPGSISLSSTSSPSFLALSQVTYASQRMLATLLHHGIDLAACRGGGLSGNESELRLWYFNI